MFKFVMSLIITLHPKSKTFEWLVYFKETARYQYPWDMSLRTLQTTSIIKKQQRDFMAYSQMGNGHIPYTWDF